MTRCYYCEKACESCVAVPVVVGKLTIQAYVCKDCAKNHKN